MAELVQKRRLKAHITKQTYCSITGEELRRLCAKSGISPTRLVEKMEARGWSFRRRAVYEKAVVVSADKMHDLLTILGTSPI